MRTRGAMTPYSNSTEIFVQCTYLPRFIILCLLVRKLSCWQTYKQTNRRRWKHQRSLLYATTLCKHAKLKLSRWYLSIGYPRSSATARWRRVTLQCCVIVSRLLTSMCHRHHAVNVVAAVHRPFSFRPSLHSR